MNWNNLGADLVNAKTLTDDRLKQYTKGNVKNTSKKI